MTDIILGISKIENIEILQLTIQLLSFYTFYDVELLLESLENISKIMESESGIIYFAENLEILELYCNFFKSNGLSNYYEKLFYIIFEVYNRTRENPNITLLLIILNYDFGFSNKYPKYFDAIFNRFYAEVKFLDLEALAQVYKYLKKSNFGEKKLMKLR